MFTLIDIALSQLYEISNNIKYYKSHSHAYREQIIQDTISIEDSDCCIIQELKFKVSSV